MKHFVAVALFLFSLTTIGRPLCLSFYQSKAYENQVSAAIKKKIFEVLNSRTSTADIVELTRQIGQLPRVQIVAIQEHLKADYQNLEKGHNFAEPLFPKRSVDMILSILNNPLKHFEDSDIVTALERYFLAQRLPISKVSAVDILKVVLQFERLLHRSHNIGTSFFLFGASVNGLSKPGSDIDFYRVLGKSSESDNIEIRRTLESLNMANFSLQEMLAHSSAFVGNTAHLLMKKNSLGIWIEKDLIMFLIRGPNIDDPIHYFDIEPSQLAELAGT